MGAPGSDGPGQHLRRLRPDDRESARYAGLLDARIGTRYHGLSAGNSEVSRAYGCRLFQSDVRAIDACARCGARLEVTASIEDPVVIGRILQHLDRGEPDAQTPFAPRAPPQWELPV